MKKSKLLLFALLPAFALSSCASFDYAANYKLVNDALKSVRAITDALEDQGYKKTINSSSSAEYFLSYPGSTTDESGNSKDVVNKITQKVKVKIADGIFESSNDIFHAQGKIEFNTFYKDTNPNEGSAETTSPEVSPSKANEGPKDESNTTDSETIPDAGESTEPETTPNEGESTEPETNPDGGDSTEPEVTPEEGGNSLFNKGVKKVGALVIDTYLFKIGDKCTFTLDGSLTYEGGENTNKTFKVYNMIDVDIYDALYKTYKVATLDYFDRLPLPEGGSAPDTTPDENNETQKTNISKAAEPETNPGDGTVTPEVTPDNIPESSYEDALRYVTVKNSNNGSDVSIKYSHARKLKPLSLGKMNETTNGYEVSFKNGVISSAKTSIDTSMINTSYAQGAKNYNCHLQEKLNEAYESLDALEIPTLTEFELNDSVSLYNCEALFMFFQNGMRQTFKDISTGIESIK